MSLRTSASHLCRAVFLISCVASCVPSLGVQECTLVACVDGVAIYPGVILSFEQLQKSSITVCRGMECFNGNFSTLKMRPPTGPYDRVVLSPPSAPSFVEISILEQGLDMLLLRINWQFVTTGPGIDAPKDGDVYHVALVDESGNNLTTLDETVTYEVSRPNGPECEPECRRAVIDKRR